VETQNHETHLQKLKQRKRTTKISADTSSMSIRPLYASPCRLHWIFRRRNLCRGTAISYEQFFLR